MPGWKPRSLSVVVPVFNEEANLRPLLGEIVSALRPLGTPFEVIVVDDGSTDGTRQNLPALVEQIPELVAILLRRNFGQTLALQAGLDRARGEVIVTMDGDRQNDPHDIPRLLERLGEGADVVSGWRRNRHDTLLLRKIPSWIANALIRYTTRVPIHDQGCSLKAYRQPVIRALDLYADMHRFIAILTMPTGASIAEVEVRHRARTAGASKYGLSRTFKVLADLFTIQMLVWFRENPLRWFALLGTPFLLLACLAGSASTLGIARGTVLPAIAFLAATTFFASLLCGLFGQAVIHNATPRRGPRVVYREWRRES